MQFVKWMNLEFIRYLEDNMKNKVFKYTLYYDNKIVYQCFNYKTAKAAKVMLESEYDKLKLTRVKYI